MRCRTIKQADSHFLRTHDLISDVRQLSPFGVLKTECQNELFKIKTTVRKFTNKSV